MEFRGRSVVITGASGGIGSVTSRLFAEEGANITVNYFSSAERAEETVDAARSYGVEAFSVKADVANPKDVASMIKETMRKFGRIDVLVNNAAEHPPPMFDFEDPDW